MTAPASPTSPFTPPEEMEVARVSDTITHFSLSNLEFDFGTFLEADLMLKQQATVYRKIYLNLIKRVSKL